MAGLLDNLLKTLTEGTQLNQPARQPLEMNPAPGLLGQQLGGGGILGGAAQRGFDTSRTWYHGTDAEFNEFSPGGTYLTANPNAASDYAAISGRYNDNPKPNVMPVFIRGRIGSQDDYTQAEAAVRQRQGRGPEDYVKRGDVHAELSKNGFDGYQSGDMAFVFDPQNIQSKFSGFGGGEQ